MAERRRTRRPVPGRRDSPAPPASSAPTVSTQPRHRPADGSQPPAMQARPVTGRTGDRWEREAEAAASRIIAGAPVEAVTPVNRERLQRAPADLDEAAPAEDREDADVVQAAMRGQADAGNRPARFPAGSGAPLPPTVRSDVERGLGTDLSHVRVHDDPTARNAADAMGARAYTSGADIYLGSGSSADDLGLMAHEATHVAQQAGATEVVQRNDGSGSPDGAGPFSGGVQGGDTPGGGSGGDGEELARPIPAGDGTYDDRDPQSILIGFTTFPTHPSKAGVRPKPEPEEIGRERTDTHGDNWRRDAAAAVTEDKVRSKLAEEFSEAHGPESDVYLLKTASGEAVIGDPGALVSAIRYPHWSEDGETTYFQVDHRLEWQLGGGDDSANLWLLDQATNASSGSQINRTLTTKIDAVLADVRAAGVSDAPPSTRNLKGRNRRNSQKKWKLLIGGFTSEGSAAGARSWTLDQLGALEPLTALAPMTAREREALGAGSRIYFSETGGNYANVRRDLTQIPKDWWFSGPRGEAAPKRARNIHVTGVEIKDARTAYLVGTQYWRSRAVEEPNEKDVKIELISHPGLDHVWFMQGRTLSEQFQKSLPHVAGLSPVELDEVQPDPRLGVTARGRLLPTVPLISEAEIDVVIEGSDLRLSKTFYGGDFDFPGPVEVTESSLELSYGLATGFRIEGVVEVAVEGVGKGRITGGAAPRGGGIAFSLAGEFDFLSDLFDPARVELWYRDDQLGGRGTLGIGEGQVAGLRSAEVEVAWNEGVLSASGTFETEMPGVERGELELVYREDGTLEIGGVLQLGEDVPGIDSGTVEVSLERDEAGVWHVVGAITATSSVPGIDGQVTGRYEDGVVDLRVSARYARGMADGEVTLGLTNRALDEGGEPVGEPSSELRAYGGGSVTVTLAPWLQATAGLRLLPNGELEVSGELELPGALDLFERTALERDLFSINLDIPIIGLAAAGQRIGIFATIGGSVGLTAYVGPAQLRELRLGVTWNPDHEEDTTVRGQAALHLPAGAAIRLAVTGALGAGIPVVSATLGLEVGGELGIEAAIGAEFDINWTPTSGLVLEAVAEASAQPRFRFDVTGFASVDLDLWLTTINLWEKRWNLAEIVAGSDLRLGVRLPVRYEEGQPFEPSLDDLELDVPTIRPLSLLGDLVGAIV